MPREINEIRIYWDIQDPENEGWAYSAADNNGLIASGGLEGIADDDIDGAITEACSILDLDLTADQFATDPQVDGGFAIWTAE